MRLSFIDSDFYIEVPFKEGLTIYFLIYVVQPSHVHYISLLTSLFELGLASVSDYYLTLNEQFFSHILARTSYSLMRWWPLCTRPTRWVGFLVLAHSAVRHVRPFWHIILILVFVLTPSGRMLSRKAINTNFIAFGWTRQGLEPTIYHTWGIHANHYTTDVAFILQKKDDIMISQWRNPN